MQALDLFCGAGGLSLGLEKAGITVIKAIDANKAAVDTYNLNLRPRLRVAEVADLSRWLPKADLRYAVDLVAGGPPCQGFSSQGKQDPNDPRRSLVREFLRVVCHLRPTMFLMENVAGLTHRKNDYLYRELKDDFMGVGYSLCEWRLNAWDYGVPQNRKRVFLIGSLRNLPELPRCQEAWSCGIALNPYSFPYPEGVTGMEVADHTVDVIERYKATPAGTKEPISRFTKLDYYKPAPTITAAGRFIHPLYPRILTVRECARLQSFPDWYQFPESKVEAYLQVGNAVPPNLAYHIGKSLLRAFQ